MDQRRKGREQGQVFCNVKVVLVLVICRVGVMGEIMGWRGVVYSAAFESARSHQAQVVRRQHWSNTVASEFTQARVTSCGLAFPSGAARQTAQYY